MSLLRRIYGSRMPRPGENVAIYQHSRLLAQGYVISVDSQSVSIAGANGLVDLDTTELRRGLHDGSIEVQRPGMEDQF